MWDKLAGMAQRYEEVTALLADPAVLSQQDRYQALAREHADLSEKVALYEEYRSLEAELEQCRLLLAENPDDETREWLEAEERRCRARMEELTGELRRLLAPRDPRDERDVLLEIRAGAGGDEAALFAADLLRMYLRFAERNRWRAEIISLNETDRGGIREVIVEISGRNAYSRLKFESGVHRVQRVPVTESAGRIHTSTATVAVLSQVEDVEVEIRPEEVQIDTFRASGPGGQHVNKTESAIRLTHLPTGIVVTCQDEKSQHKNRERAFRVLRARLFDRLQAERAAETAAARRTQVGTGDRSERIRTYNFPQGRVTDHRIGLTLHRLEEVLDGDLDELIEAMASSAAAEQMALG